MGKTWHPFQRKRDIEAWIRQYKKKYGRKPRFRILKRIPKFLKNKPRFKKARYIVAEYW